MLYQGSCHCGQTRFEIEGTIETAVSCNCSICTRKGALLWAAPRGALRLFTPDDALATYRFNKHAIAHRFCTSCGIHPFAEDADTAYINLRCVEGLDLAILTIIDFDGRAM